MQQESAMLPQSNAANMDQTYYSGAQSLKPSCKTPHLGSVLPEKMSSGTCSAGIANPNMQEEPVSSNDTSSSVDSDLGLGYEVMVSLSGRYKAKYSAFLSANDR